MTPNARAGPSTEHKRRKESKFQRNKQEKRKDRERKLTDLELAAQDFVGMLFSRFLLKRC